MVALATAFVRLRLDTSQTRSDVDRGIKGAGGEKAAQAKGRSISEAFSKGFESGGSTFGRVAATMAARATLVSGAVAAATPAVTHFVAALAPAAGVGAALPAVLASITVTSKVAKVAVMGVGDAITSGFGDNAKAAAKDLEKLHGNARIFATEVIGLRPQLEAIQRTTANRFFAPLIDEIKPLANTFFPSLRREVPQTASALGAMAGQFAHVAREGPALRAINAIFDQTQGALGRIKDAIGPVVNGIANGLVSTAPAVGTLANHFTNLAIRFGNFLTQGARTGLFIQWINEGIVTIRTLVGIIGDLGAITSTVFGEAVGSSGNLLARIKELTGNARAFVQSAQGMQLIADLFQTMGVFGDALKRSLAGVLPEIGKALAISAPAAGKLAQAIADLLISLAPLLPALAQVTATLVTALVPALTGMARWLGENSEVLRVIAPLIVAYVVASKAASAATAAWTVATRAHSIAVGIAKTAQAGWTAVSWLASAPVHAHTAAMKLSASTMGTWVGVKAIEAKAWLSATGATIKDTAAKVGNRAATLATATAHGIAAAATTAWSAVTKGATAVAVAARVATLALWTAMKAHPFIAIISIITLVVAALVKLYKENETFRRIVDQVWKAVKAAIQAVGNWFTGTLWPSMKKALDQARAAFTLLRTHVTNIWNGIRTHITAQWNLVRAIFTAIRTFVTVTLPTAFSSFRAAVTARMNEWRANINAAWTTVRGYFTAIRTFVVSTLPAAFSSFRSAVTARMNEWRTNISNAWNTVRGYFTSLRTFITSTLPNAFASGVTAMSRAWDRLKAAARTPVAFVVNQVINPLIKGWNTIAGVFGAPKASTIGGFAEGGKIPGRPSGKDNRLADLTDRSGRRVGKLAVATGEYIVNAASTSKFLPVLEAINRQGRSKGVNPAMDGAPLSGYAEGGLIGWAQGLAGKAANIFDSVTDPSGTLKKIADAAISKVPGGGFIRDLLVGAGRTLINKVVAKIKDIFSFTGGGGGGSFGAWPSSPSAQRGDSGVWRKVVAMIRATGPLSGSFGNGYRPGDPKWHGSGRAVDWMGFNQDALATYLAARKPLELIHRTNRRDYAYTRGVNKGSFNSSLMNAHKNHIHIAMALGGLVDRLRNMPAMRLLDRGGSWPSGTIGLNASGHTEQVLTGGPDGDIAELKELLAAILVTLRGLGVDVAVALQSNTNRAVTRGRTSGLATSRRA